ncbi:MAG TPA: tripartite tricarboxylate transporter substrate binding protein, partial [Ramlibacter sp.]|nr:tripartite tricarboxylate transporter substrate binding protein [Ramlibacter sp.]
EVVSRLNAEMKKVLADPEIRKNLQAGSHDIAASTPTEFAAVMAKDFQVWGDLARKLGVKVD